MLEISRSLFPEALRGENRSTLEGEDEAGLEAQRESHLTERRNSVRTADLTVPALEGRDDSVTPFFKKA